MLNHSIKRISALLMLVTALAAGSPLPSFAQPKSAAAPARPAPQPGAMDAEQIFERFVPCLVAVECQNLKGRILVGSGFIVSSDGLVIAHDRIIEGAIRISVTFNDGKKVPATAIMARDFMQDVAVIKVPGEKLPAVSISTIAKPRVGATVFAIGNPSGFSNTISQGLVSGIRSGSSRGFSKADGSQQNNPSAFLIQHTAAISVGSTGGPLFGDDGTVIGVNVGENNTVNDAFFSAPSTVVVALLAKAQSPEAQKEPAKVLDTSKLVDSKTPPKFDLAELDTDVVKRLNNTAPDYIRIGTSLWNIKLLNRRNALYKKGNLTPAEKIEVEQLSGRNVPLVVSADGQIRFHSIEDVVREIGFLKVRATLVNKMSKTDSLMRTSGGELLMLRNCPTPLADDEDFVFSYIPGDTTPVRYKDQVKQIRIAQWVDGGVYNVSAENLGWLLYQDPNARLLHFTPFKRTAQKNEVVYETVRSGLVTYRRAVSTGSAEWTWAIKTFPIDLSPRKNYNDTPAP